MTDLGMLNDAQELTLVISSIILFAGTVLAVCSTSRIASFITYTLWGFGFSGYVVLFAVLPKFKTLALLAGVLLFVAITGLLVGYASAKLRERSDRKA